MLLGFLGLCLLVGVADMLLTQPGMHVWYPSLHHPPGTPPNWVFPAVWIPLYVVMAVAVWRVWRRRTRGATSVGASAVGSPLAPTFGTVIPFPGAKRAGRQNLPWWRNRLKRNGPPRSTAFLRRRGLQLWGWQLAVNALWTPCFFGLHRPDLSMWLIGALALLVLLTMLDFRRIDRPAGLMMAPYLAWTCYAAWLNAGVVWLNPLR